MLDIWDNHLEPEVCREIIRRFEEDTPNHFQGVCGKGDGSFHVNLGHKKCTEIMVSGLDNWMDIDKIVFERMEDAIQLVADKHPGFAVLRGYMTDEGYRIKRYMPDGTEKFDMHIDVSGFATSHRQLICQWYLNDVEEGGETVFHEQDVEVKPVEGRLVTFPPFWTHSHAARPPISSPKYIISGWLTFVKTKTPPQVNKVINHAS